MPRKPIRGTAAELRFLGKSTIDDKPIDNQIISGYIRKIEMLEEENRKLRDSLDLFISLDDMDNE
jgi:hypothetical protein